MKIRATGAAVVSAVVLAACASATSGPIVGTGGGTHTTTVSHSASSSGTHTGTGGSSTTTSAGGTCTAPQTAGDCSTTCASQTPCTTCITGLDMTGYNNFNLYFFQKCGCATGSTCASTCGADPSCPSGMGTPGNACVTCLNGIMTGDPCIKATQTACKADTDCNTFLTDVQPCFTLPKP